jgi:hypothetical protein
MLQSIREKLTSRSDPQEKWIRRFVRFFPKGFKDPKYSAWERGYKWAAHEEFRRELNRRAFSELLSEKRYQEIAAICTRLESRTNLLFSFEKMAIRDGVKSEEGAEIFATGLFDLLHGRVSLEQRFERWCNAIESLPRKQTRVLTHPVVTVFPFIADPQTHIFLKPMVTRTAAKRLGIEFNYVSRPSWVVYSELLDVAERLKFRLKALRPADMIDIQSFIWVTGSSEYE